MTIVTFYCYVYTTYTAIVIYFTIALKNVTSEL